MLKKVLFFIFLICFSFILKASVIDDSTKIVSIFLQTVQNPSQFDSISKEAKYIYKKHQNNPIIRDTYLFNLAKALFQTAQLDSALIIAKQGQTLYRNDSFNYKNGKYYNVIGSIYAYKKDYESSISEFNKAVKVFDKNNDPYQAALIKNNIANIFFSLSDFENAYKYSKASYTYLKSVQDTIYLPSLTGVTAISAIELDKLEEGKKLINECLSLSEKYNNIAGLIIGRYANGEYFLAKNKFDSAIKEFIISLELSNKFGLKQYSLLNKTGLLIAHQNKGDYNVAVRYGKEALVETQQLKNEVMLYALNKHLAWSYAGLENYEKAYNHINTAHQIYRETSNAETKKAINNFLIKYETEKKEKELIEKDLLLVQDEVKLNKRKQWIIGLSVTIIFLFLMYFIYVKNQKIKLLNLKKQQEANQLLALIEGEEKERKRVANELHDGIASSISGIKIQLEHENLHNKSQTLSKLIRQLSLLHEETRRISHNLMPISITEQNLSSAIKNFCIENSTENLSINFFSAINQPLNLNQNIKNILYRVVQELVNNIQKHSKSKVCFIQMSLNDGYLSITVEDEGIGYDASLQTNSQGIKSIKQRIKQLNGTIKIESEISKGTLIIIQIPV